ncbi:DUF1707 SHOCT-like domain-containing protein [Nocardioides aurantiacus]|uniref:Uncharacterized protein DUF1707 n=1 Tax=Nocardioides aurantiacus TaxID=86796 RepID=A0A3N2CRM8_9ACTN|nr:DUF1707 domain-containing protein [Nocardioides aurantiacus]ROR90181.1 uncharacterized protein DUF1707 [Nocardioides aurantiacus]
MEPVDPSRLRISDADRHKVAEFLRQAAGEGRIDLEELDDRLEATYAAKTYGDLVPLTVDLPGHLGATPAVPPRPTGSTPPAPRAGGVPAGLSLPVHHGSSAVLGEVKRRGAWAIGESHTALAVMGNVTLDLRQARFDAPEVTITANAVMGEVLVVVDARTVVVVEGTGVMGTFEESRSSVAADTDADSPVVRVRGIALMGSVRVRRKGPPGELRRRLLGHGGH